MLDSPVLKSWIVKDLAEQIFLKNGCVFQVGTSSSRSLRGAAVPFLILDEFAHFVDSKGNMSGDLVLDAIKPAMAQFGDDARMFLPSTPWTKSGAFYDIYCKGIAGNSSIKVFKYATREVNPVITEEWLRKELELRPESYFTEYECQWAESIYSFLDSKAVDKAINKEREELAAIANYMVTFPNPQYQEMVADLEAKCYDYRQIELMVPKYIRTYYRGNYYLSLDPAKGHRDAYTACIGHYEYRASKDVFVVDLWHQFSATFAASGNRNYVNIDDVHKWILAKDAEYNFASIVLDQYQSLATIQQLTNKVNQIDELTWTRPRKQEAFSKMRDLLYAGRVEFYEHAVAINQLKNLIVKPTGDGGWTVTGGEGIAVDDYASALAGAIYVAEERKFVNGNNTVIWSR